MLFSAGIALLPFGAVYWPESLETLAASPGLLLILAAVLLAPLSRPRRMPIFRQLKLKSLLLVPVAGSVVSMAVFGLSPLFASKFLSLGLLSLIWLSPLLLADYLHIRHLRLAVLLGIGICLAGYVISDLFQALPASARDLLFGVAYHETTDARPRGFSEEASQFSATLSRLIIIYFLIQESRKRYSSVRLIGFLCALALLLVALGSKGAVFGIVIAVLSFTLRRRQLPYLLLALPGAWCLASTQFDAISVDIEQFTSTATRLTLLLTGVASTLANPLGWGYYGFYGAIQLFGGWSLVWIGDRLPALLTLEVRDIIEELNNVSTKSTALDFMMICGWLFIWLMAKIVKAIRFDDPRVRVCCVYVIISSLSTSGHQSVLAFLTFVIMLRLYPRTILASSFSVASPLRNPI